MTAITLRGLFARKLRAGLTALAVLLGVMMISGTYVFTDTINHSFDRIFETANKGVDIKVVPHKTVDSQEIPQPPFSESLLARVKSAKGVRGRGGRRQRHRDDLRQERQARQQGPGPGADVLRVPEALQPAHVRPRGAPPASPNEVTIDTRAPPTSSTSRSGTASGSGRKEPAKRYRISGLGKFGDVSAFGGATIAVLTLPEAQRISQKRGKLDEIDVAVAKGANAKEVQAELRRAAAAHGRRQDRRAGRARTSPTTSTAASAS